MELAKAGASVIITSRSRDRATAKAAEIEAKAKAVAEEAGAVHGVALDLQSFDSVRKCAAAVLELGPALHALVHNAGGIDANHPTNVSDGFEWDYTGRLASVHLLTSLLWGMLQEGGNGELGPSRVMVTIGVAVPFLMDVPSAELAEWLANEAAGELEGKTAPLGLSFGPKSGITVLVGASAWARALAAQAKASNTPVKFLLTHPGMATGTGMSPAASEPTANFLGIGAQHASKACMSNVAAVLAPRYRPAATLPDGSSVGPMQHTTREPGMFDLAKHEVHGNWKAFSGQGNVTAGAMILQEVRRIAGATIAF